MELERVIAALSPTDVVRGAPVEIRDLAYDTRAVRAGALFFCVRGERADGHELAGAAIERGAVALVVERALPDHAVPQVVVPDSREAMALAADAFFGHPTRELEVAGVTGTNGKTTTAHLLHSVLEADGRRPGLLGTVESRIGGERRPAVRTTAEAIDLQRAFRAMLDAGNRSCAMEATSHGSELKRLVGVRFAVLVFTNLTREHLDFHGTMERYFDAKRRLFVDGDPPPPAAVNVDDDYGRRLAEELRAPGRAPVLTFGLGGDADVRGDEVELDPRGASFRAAGLRVRTRLPGRFNVLNALATIAAGRLLGVGDEEIAGGIENLDRVPGRFELVDEGQPFAVVVDYSHKPDALAGVLHAARDLARERVICVFGCGGDRDRGKRPVMGRIASELSDVVVVTSDNPRSEEPEAIIEEIVAGIDGRADVVVDRRAAIARAISLARDGDVVVIAGKGHEATQEIGGRLLPFDDREVAREALRRLGAAA
ncbi:MAG: UDP-N-acetylmuramoyl-L-alanyl-D-glutamate--2,6-diaminopimelate ligase [Actinomycetota bacterium]|nr:UDP-N-acetylmuramoyl-L-alanyl-D-glutamate--2,6-diaminopimelate ligase [Actinomycetota bacterium]